MHALHRPHLPRLLTAVMVTVALAIVLSLAITSGLSASNQGSASAPVSTGGSQPGVRSAATGAAWSARPFTTSPFKAPLIAPIAQPWRAVATARNQTSR